MLKNQKWSEVVILGADRKHRGLCGRIMSQNQLVDQNWAIAKT